ncbi:TonB-dependent receptor [Pseudoduganella sp. RAF53_2]|uniref:TonB-dependent receptor n=1 Tax=unclassified Pseudoduganella TaxID=2637179 RepID=UPI003F9E6A8A
MNTFASRSALALAVSLCFAAPAFAEGDVVVISGSRFAADPALLPIGATSISAAEIRRAGAADVNQAIRKIGGVYGRQSLTGSPDFGLDLRGFGTNSDQNMVVVLDGVRLSENELNGPLLSTIPIDSVERIDIMRGGASVLYGEGATGGVIEIHTKRPEANTTRGTVYAEGGQFATGEVRGSVAKAWNDFAVDLSAGHQRTDNYRDNNEFKQSKFNGGAQWNTEYGRFGVRADIARQDNRFAGSLSLLEFQNNPRHTDTPNDFGKLDSDRYTATYEQKLGNFDIAAELSHRKKTTEATYISSFGTFSSHYDSKQTQFSPRVRHLAQFDGLLNELVTGIDFQRWNRVTDGTYETTQRSKAFYVRDEIKFGGQYLPRIAAGVRRELFDKVATDPLGFNSVYDVTQSHNAWEVQGSVLAAPNLTVYAKTGQSYRVANADENGFTPVFNQPLKTQTSHDVELGAGYSLAGIKLDARVFRHNLNNEIFYDPTAGMFGANTNLAPTRREGFEFDASANVAKDWQVSGHYQHVKAQFRDGPNDGHEMVLVPKNIVTARLAWLPSDGQTADVGVQWVDQQRYGADFANTCLGRIPSFATIDARYARRFGQWEVAVQGTNLANRHYFTAAFGCNAGIYPSDGRQLKLSVRYDF